jgi:cell division septum initiation protein DivIVA
LSELSSKIQSAQKDLERAEHENAVIAQKNVELSTRMLALAQEANTQRKEDIDDPKARQQLDELEAEMRISRQRFRIMKGTASATIAGSGIDWARDPKLLEIVLDEDGNDG